MIKQHIVVVWNGMAPGRMPGHLIEKAPDACDVPIFNAEPRANHGRIFALEYKRPHKNGPLSQGIVQDGSVTRRLRNWVISPETGAMQGADTGRTSSFPVRLDGRDIHLSLQHGA